MTGNRNLSKRKAHVTAFLKKQEQLSQQLAANMTDQEKQDLLKLSWTTFYLISLYIEKYSNICIVTESISGWVGGAISMVKHIGVFNHIYRILFEEDIVSKITPYNSIQHQNTHQDESGGGLLSKYRSFKQIFQCAPITGDGHVVFNAFCVSGKKGNGVCDSEWYVYFDSSSL